MVYRKEMPHSSQHLIGRLPETDCKTRRDVAVLNYGIMKVFFFLAVGF